MKVWEILRDSNKCCVFIDNNKNTWNIGIADDYINLELYHCDTLLPIGKYYYLSEIFELDFTKINERLPKVENKDLLALSFLKNKGYKIVREK